MRCQLRPYERQHDVDQQSRAVQPGLRYVPGNAEIVGIVSLESQTGRGCGQNDPRRLRFRQDS